MEDKNITGVLDNLNTLSVPKESPSMYRLSNIFKPTAKSKIILGMTMKVIGVGIVTLSTVVLPLAALVAESAFLIIKYGVIMNIFGIVLGGIGESIILFTKEEPISTLLRAAEDIEVTKQEDTQIEQANDNEQH